MRILLLLWTILIDDLAPRTLSFNHDSRVKLEIYLKLLLHYKVSLLCFFIFLVSCIWCEHSWLSIKPDTHSMFSVCHKEVNLIITTLALLKINKNAPFRKISNIFHCLFLFVVLAIITFLYLPFHFSQVPHHYQNLNWSQKPSCYWTGYRIQYPILSHWHQYYKFPPDSNIHQCCYFNFTKVSIQKELKELLVLL